MKKYGFLFCWIIALIAMPIIVQAQDYDKLWKEVETLKKKDHPRSVIDKTEKIFTIAEKSGNIPQMIKAFIVCGEYKVKLSPDSADIHIESLKEWASREKSPAVRAVLNGIIAQIYSERSFNMSDSILYYSRLSLSDKDKLAGIPAEKFYPIVESKEVSRTYFNDNMYDFLSRQAINVLSSCYDRTKTELFAREIISVYDSLVSLYSEGIYADRAALALTEEARLIYMSDYCRSNKYRISHDEAVSRLEGLSREYKDLDVYCDIILKLAGKYSDKERFSDAVNIIDNALVLYPKTRWTKELKAMKEHILEPSLNVNFSFVYPEYESDMIVRYKNLTDVKVETYRLNLIPSSPCILYGGMEYQDILRKYGSRVAVANYTMSPTPDYKTTVANLKYKFPEAGIYMLKLTTSAKGVKPELRIVHVSPYQCIVVSLPGYKKEFIAVDCLTGNPVPGAEIVSYKRTDGEHKVYKVYKTNKAGSVVIDLAADKMEYFNVRTLGNDFMDIGYYYNRGTYRDTDEKSVVHTSLFTDRSIYRPGQKVILSGIKYRMSGDSTYVEKNSHVSLVMRDSNWKEIATKEVITDDLGVYSSEFIIPETAFPGYFSVIADNTQSSIKVEEYKRPTFDVVFDELKNTYTFNDSVSATVLAETFAGVPLRMAKVKYRIMRGESWWWRGVGAEEEISSGETMTGADGKFSVYFKLVKPDSYTGVNPLSYYRYRVIADVTSTTGETQEGVLNISVGEKSVGLRIEGMPIKVAREKSEKIRFAAVNLNSVPVDTEVEYNVYRKDEEGNKLSGVVCRGKYMSNKSFVPDNIYSLPSGAYIIELKAYDEKKRECTYTQDFVLFSLNDTKVPIKTTEWFWQDGTELSADKPVDIYVGTSEKDVYLLVDVFTLDKRISSERISLNDTIRKFSYKYRPEYGDGISVTFNFMRNGKLYSKSVTMLRPQPDKKLEIKWETFRDNLLPGQNEVWKLSVKDKDGNPVEANMLASAYDASLDKLYPHKWNFGLYFKRNTFRPFTDISQARNEVSVFFPFGRGYYSTGISHIYGDDYSRFMPMSYPSYTINGNGILSRSIGRVEFKSANAVEVAYGLVADSGFDVVTPEVDVEESMMADDADFVIGGVSEEHIALRENFNETAFYYPMLRTDSTGTVTLSFVMPDALTEWKFNGFAHTCNMDYGIVSASFTTSKPFMVQPNMPRFVRVGDKSSVSSSLINMTDSDVSGKVTMILENPLNGKKVLSRTQDFHVAEGETGTVTFHYEVGEEYDILACIIIAEAGEFSDGERHYLPVLSNRQLVVENISLQLKGNETKTVEVKKLFNSGSSSATDRKVRIEMTANPQWHIISSLPVLSTPANNDAVSWATAFYANSLSSHILRSNPKIKKVFDTWMMTAGKEDDFLSELKRNEALKNIVMTETPWLVEADNEEIRKQQIAFLFDENGMSSRISTSVSRLKELQLADGSWSWFSGMQGNRYITTRIAVMLARLRSMGVPVTAEGEMMYSRCLAYLRSEVYKDYQQMKKDENKFAPNDMDVMYLYICAIDDTAMKSADKTVNDYIIGRLMGKSSSLSIYEKSLMATIMNSVGKKQEAGILLKSIMEYMVHSEEMGAYFDTYKSEYSYMNYRIPSHVAAMEAVMRLSGDKTEVLDDMRLWLLKQKQVQVWSTPIESADAVYAFLISEGGNIDNTSVMTANIGTEGFSTSDDVIGFAGKDYTGSEFKYAVKGEKKISFTRRGEGTGWISVFTNYREDIDKIGSYQGSGLSISRKYLLDGKEIDSRTVLEKGNRLTVCLTVKSDRDMDFVCIKDSKAACMEPAEHMSAYQYTAGLSYYRVTRDTSTEFFIDKMRKGTYTIKYDVYVTREGVYTSGTSTIISVYAPQFMSYFKGAEIQVIN